MNITAYKNKVLGSMIGGAVGDALGYPVEFMSYSQIIHKYGPSGITRYHLNADGVAEISDDTQMSLYTANGVLYYQSLNAIGLPAEKIETICAAYIAWLDTQTELYPHNTKHRFWISNAKELYVRRAPGVTCMSALRSLKQDQAVVNDSKGCGGIMRVAPIALHACNPADTYYSLSDSLSYAKEAGDVAALTHKNPLGYIPAAFLYLLIENLLPYAYIYPLQLYSIVDSCFMNLEKIYPDFQFELYQLQQLISKAKDLALSSENDQEAIMQLGEGWTADEALAIALYCSMKYYDDLEKAIIAAVNHSGDSDSTGAITGNIMGALYGYEAIPYYYKQDLELRWLIEALALDLATDVPVAVDDDVDDTPEKKAWRKKYLDA